MRYYIINNEPSFNKPTYTIVRPIHTRRELTPGYNARQLQARLARRRERQRNLPIYRISNERWELFLADIRRAQYLNMIRKAKIRLYRCRYDGGPVVCFQADANSVDLNLCERHAWRRREFGHTVRLIGITQSDRAIFCNDCYIESEIERLRGQDDDVPFRW